MPLDDQGNVVPVGDNTGVLTAPPSYSTLAEEQSNLGDTGFDYGDTYNSTQVSNEVDSQNLFTPSESYINPSATVKGQLEDLLSSDSKYIQDARLRTQEQSASRGLLNSSIAAREGERAAISEGYKIASQDASTYATAAGLEQQYNYEVDKSKGNAIISAAMVDQEAQLNARNQAYQNAYQANLNKASAEEKAWLADVDQQYQKEMLDLSSLQEQILADQQYDLVVKQDMYNSFSEISQNYSISVETLMTDPDFLALGADAVNKTLNEMQSLATNNIKFLGNAQGIDMGPLVDEYFGTVEVL